MPRGQRREDGKSQFDAPKMALFLYLLTQIRGKLLLFLALVLVDSFVFSLVEGWDLFTSLYYTLVTISTVGYGDITPTRQISRVLAIFLILSGISIFTLILQTIIDQAIELRVDPLFLARLRLKNIENHVIILGYGNVGSKLASFLRAYQEREIVIVDHSEESWKLAEDRHYISYLGDASDAETLRAVRIEKAKAVFITLHDDETTVLANLLVKSMNPNIPTFIHVRKKTSLDLCKDLGNTAVVWENHAMIIALNEDLFQVPAAMLQSIVIDHDLIVTWVYSSEETSLGALQEFISHPGIQILGYVDPITQEFIPLRYKPDPWEVMGKDLIVIGQNTDLQTVESFDLDHFVHDITHENLVVIGYTPEMRHALSVISPLTKRIRVVEWNRERQELATIDGYELIRAHPLNAEKFGGDIFKDVDLIIVNGLEDQEAIYTILFIRSVNKSATILSGINNQSLKPYFIRAGCNHFLDAKRAAAQELLRYYVSEIEATKIYFANGRLELFFVDDLEKFWQEIPSNSEIMYFVEGSREESEITEEKQVNKILLFIPQK